MLPDTDHRHGTPAGRKAGCACAPCVAAHKRRCKEYQHKRLQMGGSTTVDATRAAAVLAQNAERMSLSAIGRALGTSHTWVAKVIRGDIKRISPARERDVLNLDGHQPADTSHVSALGPMRRLRALHSMGYSWTRLAEETGYSLSGLKAVAWGHWEVIEAHNATTIRALYDRLSLTLPTSDNQYVRSGIARARNNGRRQGWPPPLAWDDIDDPDEKPADWHYKPPARTEQFAALVERGATLGDVLRELRVGREALEKWCARNGLNREYSALVAAQHVRPRQGRWAS